MIRKYTVVPKVPERLKPLLAIARNLWWTYNRNAVALFRRVDPDLFQEFSHNPIQLLGALRAERMIELSEDDAFLAHMDSVFDDLKNHLQAPTWHQKSYSGTGEIRVAYFSAEFGLHESLPLYSGGLGVLAGDHIKSSEELGLPLVGVGLAYHQGYNHQYLSSDGWQLEQYPDNDFFNMPMIPLRDPSGHSLRIELKIGDRQVWARIWKVQVGRVAVYLLDTNLATNAPKEREITRRLYGGDLDMRVRQEILLGIGGLKLLDCIDYQPTVCHMNEGHSAFLGLERIRRLMESQGMSFEEAREATAAGTIFTTHTPVPAGNDRFPADIIRKYFTEYAATLGLSIDAFLALGRENPDNANEHFCMTVLALRLASNANGVSKLHGSISRKMWKKLWPAVPEPEIPVGHVTNGVHTHSWLSDEFSRLFERYLGPLWRDDPLNRRVWLRVDEIPDNELWRAKERLRDRLVSFARSRLRKQLKRLGVSPAKLAAADEALDPEVLTIGFARRFATYKRADLIFREADRVRRLLLDRDRPIQLLFAGKSHPQDQPGKELIRKIVQRAKSEEFQNRIVFLEDYDMDVARHLVQGADVWLNTPRRPLEASGTSGMKAAINGTLNLSILDGWWCEGYSGDNGWAIGGGEELPDRDYQDWVESEMLYDLLEQEVIPLFYDRGPDAVPRPWVRKVKASVRTCGPQFNTNRMVQEYSERMYLPAAIQASMLAKDGYRAARELAGWKRHVRDCWHEVSILSVEADTSTELEVGCDLELKVRATLGKLTPEEIVVEILYGPLDSKDEIQAPEALRLNFKATDDGGAAEYHGYVPCQEAGRHGFAVRVLPFRRELANKFEPGLITWWNGGDQVASEHVTVHAGSDIPPY